MPPKITPHVTLLSFSSFLKKGASKQLRRSLQTKDQEDDSPGSPHVARGKKGPMASEDTISHSPQGG